MEDRLIEQYLEKTQGRDWIGERLRAWQEGFPNEPNRWIQSFLEGISASTRMAAFYNHQLIEDDVFVCNAEAGAGFLSSGHPAFLIRGSFLARVESKSANEPLFYWLASSCVFEFSFNSSDERIWQARRDARGHCPANYETATFQDKMAFYIQDLDVSLVFPTRFYCFAKKGDTRLFFHAAGQLRGTDFSFLGKEQMEVMRQQIRAEPDLNDQHYQFLENIERNEQSKTAIKQQAGEIAHLRNELDAEAPREIYTEERFSLENIGAETGLDRKTISDYVNEMRSEDAEKPEEEQRIKTPKGGQLTRKEINALKIHIAKKAPRPNRRKKLAESTETAQGSSD